MSTASEPPLSVFTLWAVFRRDPAAPSATAAQVDSLNAAIAAVEADGITIRGFYDVSGMRADADLMVWMHGNNPEALQGALRQLRRTDLLKPLLPTWNAMGVDRGAEFNASHVPAFVRGLEPKGWMTVYPFVRSYEWYLLSTDERSGMLARHGRLAGPFPGVLSNTV